MINTDSATVRHAEYVFRDILGSLGGFEAIEVVDQSRKNCDLVMEAKSGRAKLRFGIEAKKLLTPRRALGSYQNLRRLPKDFIRLIFAPVISPRVASLAKEQGIGYFDAAGNCWIHSERDHLLIERNGRESTRQMPRSAADPFSPKSSRIVRAMLSEPTKGWQVADATNSTLLSASAAPSSGPPHALARQALGPTRWANDWSTTGQVPPANLPWRRQGLRRWGLFQTLEDRKIEPHIPLVKEPVDPKTETHKTRLPGIRARHRMKRRMSTTAYQLSQRCRKKVEECFGWMKSVAGMRRSRTVGRWKLRQMLEVAAAAFNLVRRRRLVPETG